MATLEVTHAGSEKAAPSAHGVRRDLLGVVFVAPAVTLLTAFVVGPSVANAMLSVFEWSPLQPALHFVGTGNVSAVLASPEFWVSLRNTIVYAAVTVPASIGLGLAVAVGLDRRRCRWTAFLRVVYFLPTAATLVAVAAVWKFLLDPQVGLLNQFLTMIGAAPQAWLIQSHTVLPAIIVFGVWQHVGYMMVLYLAGLGSIPTSLKEAAAMDGLRGWQRLRHFLWPLLRPTTGFAAVIGTISAFELFDQVLVMTGGGPGYASSSLAILLWREGFRYYAFGRAAVVSIVLFLLILAVTFTQYRLIGRTRHAI